MSKCALTHAGFTGTSEVSFEDDCLHGKVMFIDDLITYEGASPAELRGAFVAAVERYLAYCAKTGKPANKPYSGTFNVRTGSEIHRNACKAAAESEQSLNDFVKDCIVTCLERRQFVVEQKETHHHYYKETYDEETVETWSQRNQQPENRPH
jgi:predicted HicB family RNase H-like nuclease